MKKLLTGLLLVLIAAYGGFKVYLWHEASQALKLLKQALAQEAVLEYGWISSSLRGEVKVQDIRVTPFALKDTIHIAAASFKVPNGTALLRLIGDAERKQMPDVLEWRLEGVRLGLSSPLLEEFVSDPVSQAFSKVACGKTSMLGPQEWRAMGYDHLLMDLRGGYRYDRIDQRLKLNLALDTQAMSLFELDVLLKLTDPSGGFGAQLIQRPPQLDYVRLSYQDDSYLRRVAHFCGRQSELKEAAYQEQSVKLWTEALAGVGITVTDDLKAAYRLWLEGDKRLLIELDPRQEVDYALLPFIKPVDALELLGTSVRVDGFVVQDLAVQWNPQQLSAALMPSESGVPQAPVRQQAPAPAQPRVSFKVTEFDQLAAYQDYPVRVSTAGGRLYEGKLVSAQEAGVEVGSMVSGGMITYPVRRSDIVQVEVYR